MRQSSASARFTAIALCLLCASGLAACNRNYIKPDSAPMAPRVSCDAGPAEQIPPVPALAGIAEWAVQVMGLYQSEVTKRAGVRKCLSDMRAAGVIR